MYKFLFIMLGLLLTNLKAEGSYVTFEIANRSGETIEVASLYTMGQGASNSCGQTNVHIHNGAPTTPVSPCSSILEKYKDEDYQGTIEIYRYDKAKAKAEAKAKVKDPNPYRYCKDYSASMGQSVPITFTEKDCSWL